MGSSGAPRLPTASAPVLRSCAQTPDPLCPAGGLPGAFGWRLLSAAAAPADSLAHGRGGPSVLTQGGHLGGRTKA